MWGSHKEGQSVCDTLQVFTTDTREGIWKTWWYSERALRLAETIISPLSHVRHLPLVCVCVCLHVLLYSMRATITVLFNSNCNFNWLTNGESKTSFWTHLKTNVHTSVFVLQFLHLSYWKESLSLSLSHTHLFIWFTYLSYIFFLCLCSSLFFGWCVYVFDM